MSAFLKQFNVVCWATFDFPLVYFDVLILVMLEIIMQDHSSRCWYSNSYVFLFRRRDFCYDHMTSQPIQI